MKKQRFCHIQEKPSAPNLDHEPESGRIGNWQLLRLLGTDAVGPLYLATNIDQGMNTVVAVRILKKEYSKNPSLVKRFLQEAERFAQLEHPNIARVLDYGTDDIGRTFVVREYIAGSTVKELVADGPIDFHMSKKITIELCQILEEISSEGLIHRNITPSNIVVDISGKCHLVDGGQSRVLPLPGYETTFIDDLTRLHEDFHYFSPEKLCHQKLDIRSEIYSIGCIAHLLFAGVDAFCAREPVDVISAKLSALNFSSNLKYLNLEAVPGHRRSVIEKLEKVIERSLLATPALRYQTPSEMLSDLLKVDRTGRLSPGTYKQIEKALNKGLLERVRTNLLKRKASTIGKFNRKLASLKHERDRQNRECRLALAIFCALATILLLYWRYVH